MIVPQLNPAIQKTSKMDDKIQTAVIFQTFSVLLNLLNKTLILMAEKGADQKNLDLIVNTINSMMELINEYAESKVLEKEQNEQLNELCKRFKIDRAPQKNDEGEMGEE